MNTLKTEIKKYGASKLAKSIGVTKGCISHVMNDKRKFGANTAKRVAKVLNIPLSHIRPDIWD
jgi:plasmid maintenance system antidote protein VapI